MMMMAKDTAIAAIKVLFFTMFLPKKSLSETIKPTQNFFD
jgi:hypothetical protein